MGDVSDIGDLLGKWRREKRGKLLWALGTAAFTVLSTTATVSWTLRGYVDELARENEKLRGQILVMDKKIERLEENTAEADKRVTIVKETADRALLFAQLAHKEKP